MAIYIVLALGIYMLVVATPILWRIIEKEAFEWKTLFISAAVFTLGAILLLRVISGLLGG